MRLCAKNCTLSVCFGAYNNVTSTTTKHSVLSHLILAILKQSL